MRDYNTIKIHLLLVFSSLLVSSSFTVGEWVAREIDPVLLTLLRFCIGAICFVPLVWRDLTKISVKDIGRYGLISCALVMFFWAMFESLKYTTALNTSAIFTLVPMIVAVYSMIIVKEVVGKKLVVSLVLGALGALMIIFHEGLTTLGSITLNYGDWLFFAGCLAMGFYAPLVKLFHRGEPMMVMVFWIIVIGCFLLIPLAWPMISVSIIKEISLSVWVAVVYLGVFTTVVTFYITQISVLHLGPTRVTAYSYLYPVLVIVLDYMFFAKWPGVSVMPGVMLVVVAMLVIQKNKLRVLDNS